MKKLLESQLEMLQSVSGNDLLIGRISADNHWEHIDVKRYLGELIQVGQYDNRSERMCDFLNEIRTHYLHYVTKKIG